MATNKNNTPSIEELHLRYERFCQNNGLDASISPENQDTTFFAEKTIKWLDTHIARLSAAEYDDNHNKDLNTISTILADLGRSKEITKYALRKGETLISNLVIKTVKTTTRIVAPKPSEPAPEAIANGVQTKSGFQLGLTF